METIPVQISKDEADEQQAHSMIPKTERYTDTLKQTLTKQRQKTNTKAYSRKCRKRKRLYINVCGKERKNRPQMPVAKKERPNGGKCWWQTKNGCLNRASKQLTLNEINKKAETTSKPQTVGKTTTTKTQKHHQITTVCSKGVDDYSLKSTEQK